MIGTKFLLAAIASLSFGAFAADEQANDGEHNVCERLLDADLSGFYVVHNLNTKRFSLVQLRRMGHSPAYTVAEFKINHSDHGMRELEFQRLSNGWPIGDELHPERRVNVMNLQREGQNVAFRFEDTSDVTGFYYMAKPEQKSSAIEGDILNPSRLSLQFDYGVSNASTFTRIQLDNLFESILTPAMKQQLATRLDQQLEQKQEREDSVIVVELKKPLTPIDAARLLGARTIVPLEEAGANRSNLATRFAVPMSLLEFLQAWPGWARRWEVARVDSVPLRQFHFDILNQLGGDSATAAVASVRQVQQSPPQTPRRDTRLAPPQINQPPAPPAGEVKPKE